MSVKQVIVWRADLKCRTGKKMAQIAHASGAWLITRLEWRSRYVGDPEYKCELTPPEIEWINNGIKKIVLQVENEKELLEIYEKAKEAGLVVEIIKDAGLTEFNEPTLTALAIGPDEEKLIDPITQHLKLY
jgi:peptidyl-tRNA hydrolase, PTH2 family